MNVEIKHKVVIEYLQSLKHPVAIEQSNEGLEVQSIVLDGKLFCFGDITLSLDLNAPGELSEEAKELLVSLFSAEEEPLVEAYAEYFLERFQAAKDVDDAVVHSASCKDLAGIIQSIDWN
ncbi:hypothetical protein ACKF11_13185 [Methylobacillus sp. Pita2]|uniref:hypothetical protein n=1 Tax=Methylobacillus sp. Pita2 TaxID=3383245 RepID=UPI0038B66871